MMINKQILNMIAAYLHICACKLKTSDQLIKLGLTGNNLSNIKMMFENNFKIKISELDIIKARTIKDLIDIVEHKMYRL